MPVRCVVKAFSFVTVLFFSTTLLAQTGTRAGTEQSPPPTRKSNDAKSLRDVCLPGAGKPVGIHEMRAPERLDQDLLLVDGINEDRDVVVVFCRDVLQRTFRGQIDAGQAVLAQVRAWHKPKEGGWREIRLNEPSVQQVQRYLDRATSEANWRLEERNIRISKATAVDATVVVPLRRDAVKVDDLVRLRVTIAPEIADEPPAAMTRATAAASDEKTQGDTKQGAGAVESLLSLTAPENEQVIDTTFKVGRFGLHIRFSDLAVFVQRLGEDRANNRGTSDVFFDQVNFRPAPGISYGFNYYHRRRALFRFLEPGFGAHLAFLNWNDRPRNAATSDAETTQVTNLQIGLGGMVSMFDGTVVVVSGWNLQVKDQRGYLGVGFSITGLAQKFSQGIR